MAFKEASRYGSEALREFSWSGYAPFFSMLMVEALFLFLGFHLDRPWGMGTAGLVAALLVGKGATHYPGYFLVLPAVFTYVDVAVYTVLGAALIPLALTRILPLGRPRPGEPTAAGRVRAAVLPSFVTFAVVLGIIYLWERAIPLAIAPIVRAIPRVDFLAPAIIWLIGTLVGLLVSTLALYVPIVAIRERGGLGAIGRGLADGLRMLPATYVLVLVISAAPLAVTAFVQTSGSTLAARLRPEILPWLLLAYAVLMSLANYLIYAAAARMHAAVVTDAE